MKPTEYLLDGLLVFFSILAGCAAGVSIYTGLGSFDELEWEVLVTGYSALIAAIFTIRAMIRTDARQEIRHRQLIGINLRHDALKVDRYYGKLENQIEAINKLGTDLIGSQEAVPEGPYDVHTIDGKCKVRNELSRFCHEFRSRIAIRGVSDLLDFDGLKYYSNLNDSIDTLFECADCKYTFINSPDGMIQVPVDINADVARFLVQLIICRDRILQLYEYFGDLRARYASNSEIVLTPVRSVGALSPKFIQDP